MADTRQYPNPGDKELPEVNADDEGKVLAVVKGAWDKAGSQIELPVVTSEDNGKLLGVTGGKWDSVNAPTELPAVTNEDNGRILQVSNGSWTKQNMPTELPAVTATDNGKVLGVADGNWGVVNAPSGGGSAFIISGTYNSYGELITCDKTPTEIRNAFSSGSNNIWINLTSGSGVKYPMTAFDGYTYPLTSYYIDINESIHLIFAMIDVGDGYTLIGRFTMVVSTTEITTSLVYNNHNADYE